MVIIFPTNTISFFPSAFHYVEDLNTVLLFQSNRTRPDAPPATPARPPPTSAPTYTPTDPAATSRRHPTTPAPPRRNATEPALSQQQQRQNHPNLPNSRLYGYFTAGRDAQRVEEEMQEEEQ
jgi:hypothetical protein